MRTNRIILTWITAYTVAGFVAIEISFYTILCQPFSQYWAVPADNEQCATYSIYSIIQTAFNLSSFTLIMGIGSSVVYHSSLPIKRKIFIMVLFCVGIITEVAAILST